MDDSDLNGALVAEVLEWIEGAHERSSDGLAQAKRGEVMPVADLAGLPSGPER
jgi:hypothetical protein